MLSVFLGGVNTRSRKSIPRNLRSQQSLTHVHVCCLLGWTGSQVPEPPERSIHTRDNVSELRWNSNQHRSGYYWTQSVHAWSFLSVPGPELPINVWRLDHRHAVCFTSCILAVSDPMSSSASRPRVLLTASILSLSLISQSLNLSLA